MYILHRIVVFLRRWRHSRGFGVQSPTDYRFLRSVVNEHTPYYAYDQLNSMYRSEGKLIRKMGRLYLRLVNSCQPALVLSINPPSPAYHAYMQAGSASARIIDVTLSDCQNYSLPEYDMLRISASRLHSIDLEHALSTVRSDAVWVVEDIHRGKDNYHYWTILTGDERTRVCYDLYYCGIIFFDTKRYKQKYKVNF